MDGMDYSKIRGFNYQPSYGSHGLEIWRRFDADIVDVELARGRKYFPGMNAIRLWLSWDAFNRDAETFARSFDLALALADGHGMMVMPVLFNRWHNEVLDFGGLYIDHFLPDSPGFETPDLYTPFMEKIVGEHAHDRRVFAWDLCNEPFAYMVPPYPGIVDAEFAWLEGLYDTCKRLGAEAPITVGIHPGHKIPGIRQIEPLSDLLSIHPYWMADRPAHDKEEHERVLDDYVGFSAEVGKPMLVTETCWGAVDDAERVEIIRYTLSQLRARNLGWLAHIMHHSLIADAHGPEYGYVGQPGNMSFIDPDGSLRAGHGVFNEY